MVGVPGKSKGCSTCRKRKKGCDLARPSCGQCLKRGDVCGGYQRDLTFIHHRLPGKDGQIAPEAKTLPDLDDVRFDDHGLSNASSDDGSSGASFEKWKSPTASADQSSRDSSVLVQRRHSPQPSLQLLSSALSLTALTSLHTSLFNSLYLPRNSLEITEPGLYGHPANWTQFLPTLLNNEPSLQIAYLALSSSRIGHDHGDDDLVAASRKFYSKALRELQRALASPKRRHTEETLLACSTLGLYEIFEAKTSRAVQVSPAINGWLSHATGVGRLLEARGPDSYTTDKGHTIFLHARIIIAIRASAARKISFLSEPQWLTAPWRNHAKNTLHQLIDVMVFLPVIMENYDTIEAKLYLDLKQRYNERRYLLALCSEFSDQLRRWYSQLCADAAGQSLWTISLPNDPAYPFPVLISFDDHLFGYTITLYWTCSLVIHGAMRQLQHLLNTEPAFSDQETNLPDHIDPELYARNIAQTMPYFLNPDMGAMGPNLALLPLGMAFGYFAAPTRPSFVADSIDLASVGAMVDILMKGEISSLDKSTTDILLWFIALFTGLSSRQMPGGDFLLELMKAIGNTPIHEDPHSMSEI